MTLHTLTIAVAAALAVVFSALVLWERESRTISSFALVSAVLGSVWVGFCDLRALADPVDFLLWRYRAAPLEGAIPLLWYISSLGGRVDVVSGATERRKHLLAALPVLAVMSALPLLLPTEAFFYSPDFSEEHLVFLGDVGYVFYIICLVALTTALAMIERTLTALSSQERWQKKFELIGVGAILTVGILYYSQGLLFRCIDMELAALRDWALVLGLILATYSRAKRDRYSRVRISPNMAYRSITFVAVGGYLVVLGLMGEGMRYLGGDSRQFFYGIIAIPLGTALVILLFSEGARRKLKVFLHKNFYEAKYEYRTHWLEFTEQLGDAGSLEELEQTVLGFYCRTFGLRGGALYLREEKGGAYNLEATHEMGGLPVNFAADSPLPRELSNREWVFNVSEEHPEIGKLHAEIFRQKEIAYIVPLIGAEGLEGFAMLMASVNREEQFTYEDFDLLRIIARHAANAILNVKLSQRLSAAREMEAMGRVSTFVMHDLKNLVSNLTMVGQNAEEHIDDPEFREDMLETVQQTANRMKELISRLSNLREKRELNLTTFDLFVLVEEATELVPSDKLEVTGKPLEVSADRAELQRVVLNLVINALEATGEGKEKVRVQVSLCDDTPCVRVSDSGCGIETEFIRQQLFKPFITTKKKGFGVGLYQCKLIAEAHGGSIEVQSTVGEGSTFTLLLPKQAAL